MNRIDRSCLMITVKSDYCNLSTRLRHTIFLSPKADSKRRRKKGKSLFPLSACADNRSRTITSKECVEIAKVLHGNKGEKPTLFPVRLS